MGNVAEMVGVFRRPVSRVGAPSWQCQPWGKLHEMSDNNMAVVNIKITRFACQIKLKFMVK